MLADDSATFTEPVAEATDIPSDIHSNTKVLVTDGLQTTVHQNGGQIKQVKKFRYL